jgi:ABC-type nitrate/sulfonate/bicarbonate transport system permease component
MPLLFIAIFCLIAITLVFYTLLTLIERRLTAWYDH